MLRTELTEVIATSVKKLYGVSTQPEIAIAQAKLGDFSTNIALKLAGELKKSPKEIAEEIAEFVKHSDIATVEAAGAGFINITMSDKYWAQKASQISSNYAQNNSGAGKKVQVEFISANPTGPLTLGNGRGGYNGDVLANVLTTSGYKVSREYYINDAGNQISELGKSITAHLKPGAQDQELQYQGSYVRELATKLSKNRGDIAKEATKLVISDLITPSVNKMGIKFDVWLSEEKDLHQAGKVDKILKLLEQKNLVEIKAGAKWLQAEVTDERDRVLVKSDGSYSYLLVDIAYHYNKLVERGFDEVINLWGADHAGQVPSLQLALKLLGLEGRLKVIIFQLVRLIKDGKEFKVSKRAGTYVTIDELLEQVPSDVARFFFLMRGNETHMDFDLNLAREQSQKNPLYYVMYAYARSCSILEKAKTSGLAISKKIVQLNKQEKLLIKQLLQLPEVIEDISRTYEVHKLSFYGIELAKIFHELYEREQIIALEPKLASQKLFLIAQFKVAAEAYFKILGITPQSKM